MKRIIFASIAAGLLLFVVGLIYVGSAPRPNWSRVFVAAWTYQEQLTKAGQAIPETVSPQELVERNLLSAGDAVGLEGVKIRFPAVRKPDDYTAALMEVTMPDGTRLAAFADGSAGAFPKNSR